MNAENNNIKLKSLFFLSPESNVTEKLAMIAHIYKTSIQVSGAGEWLRVLGNWSFQLSSTYCL